MGPAGDCFLHLSPGATFSAAAFESITAGNSLGEKDAWGRPLDTMTFRFEIAGSSSGTTTPSLTARWN